VTSTHLFANAAHEFDIAVQRAIQRKAQLPPIESWSHVSLELLGMPVRLGGLGLRPARLTSPVARIVRARHSDWPVYRGSPTEDALLRTCDALASLNVNIPKLCDIARATLELPEPPMPAAPTTAPPTFIPMMRLFIALAASTLVPAAGPETHRILQKTLMHGVETALVNELHVRTLNAWWRAHLRGVLAARSGHWLQALTEDDQCRLSEAAAAHAMRLRLGFPPADNLSHCGHRGCQIPQPPDAVGNHAHQVDAHHVQSCMGTGAWLLRHDTVKHAIVGIANRAWAATDTEVDLTPDGNRRIDVVIKTTDCIYYVDVSVVHTNAPSNRGFSPDDCIKQREDRKRRHYEGCLAGQRGTKLVPFVLSTYGQLSPAASTLLQDLAKRVTSIDTDVDYDELLTRFHSRVGVALQRGNLAVVETIAKDPRFPTPLAS